MYAAADLSWPGGKAKYGDQVDPDAIPALTRARWEDEGFLTSDAPAPRDTDNTEED